jgi:hypothetical protein
VGKGKKDSKCILCVAVSSVRQRSQRRQVVEPVQAGLVGDGVDAAEQQVHVVWFPRAQAGRKLSADEVCERRWREVGFVAHGVELRVGLDVLGELDCGQTTRK